MKITLLGTVNFILFQWFFIRLTKCSKRVITDFELESISMIDAHNATMAGKVKKDKTVYWWAIQYWIYPLSGWRNNFIYTKGGQRFLKITNESN